ncbi:MAG TPA: nucleoside 2-deoxyribosyltransferase, partial [Candidatus Limnocylindrales bacterium]|nr:nucleoside 2-deoxyribosyltransferase [Candidatus Limnocylindrales bacterium]
TGERDFNAAVGARLREAGHEVFLPQDQELNAYDPARIFRNDVDHVDWSTVVVGIMDGPDPDSGTAWEIGYAYAKGTPIILLRTDFREWGGRTGEAPYNLMLTESATERIELATPSVEAAAAALIAALARLEAPAA